MANEQTIYTVETSKGNHSFTTNQPHTQFTTIEAWLKAHKNSIDVLKMVADVTIEVYAVYMTHHGKKTILK